MNNPLTSPRTRKAANVLGIVLLIAVVAPFAVYAAPEIVGADESFVVLTPSMTPAIAPGDVVVVAERDPAAVAEGDVITFARGTGDVPVTHRVIDVVDEGGTLAFETMGDANEGPDPGLVPAGNLVGVVTLTIPYIGYVIQFAGTQVGFVALVLLPFGLLAVTEVWSIVRGRDDSESPASPTAEAAAAGEPDATPGAAAAVSASNASDASDASTATGSGGVSVDAVGGAAAVLAAFAPYAVYVAFEVRTAVAIAIAVGASTLLLGALAVWVPASGVLDRGGSAADRPGDGDAPSPDRGATATEEPASGADWESPDVVEGPEGAREGTDDQPAIADGASETGDAPAPAAAVDAPAPAPPTAPPPTRPDGAGEGD
ncbi:peptidase S26B, signal peptidase [Halorubrum saccharovorum DSM 1137]|uniref:Peptidase S26B, signal peptidase n=1 Tax=Halorubrum saccharovorum DSM 1137 TaxID=1227484 RepID=M0DUM4_9EURY|nr:signal peptidase I [Halorubrum saccharovorum]ELZ38407.1 peptidase S26B, signal peptidase [Halorubrum saccharovorum DSM 1137]